MQRIRFACCEAHRTGLFAALCDYDLRTTRQRRQGALVGERDGGRDAGPVSSASCGQRRERQR
ncbi:MAG: hypothetical protein CSB49_07400 [Proteobacteria bacterium]|nr:MAG: hypothetical protein CSB49_07400 [Pseudomonadota bacterium]